MMKYSVTTATVINEGILRGHPSKSFWFLKNAIKHFEERSSMPGDFMSVVLFNRKGDRLRSHEPRGTFYSHLNKEG